ncbi:MAG TPA: N-acetylglutaminylglutamine synthetase [Rhodospirillaceae bacterium]|nr:N-acetylglutaminylglutamine synthetase [Alphaproteobacteria bacterium]MAS47905.1 N-acetylglutaminylglutamine synthetase [Alphaproteobacteria bacterium]MAX97181.1 N-acetylglutaminylglutamine synthetase [Alphaproteobacteria bacterium]OUT40037.1 MAG: GNAT family N-acetyltransferase [Micavibrio sp. TMED2]HCI47041.1 N-acetylglutaminylglutamine synthetase [Rhodospirillaceae bacterium]|tara:strand:+ start:40450 stop:42261 length:1812 start_codon:yes stop_codon:yes gene_type:complete
MAPTSQVRQRSQEHRLRRIRSEGMRPPIAVEQTGDKDVVFDCGWGRLIFAQTFESTEALADTIRAEAPEQRDIAFYVKDPHLLLANAPQELFLDPSHAFRLDLATYRAKRRQNKAFFIRRLTTQEDAEAINLIYSKCGMVNIAADFFWSRKDARALTVLVAEDAETGEILASVMGVDHHLAFKDPERGSSLWCLSVSPQAPHAGLGEALVRHLAEHFKARGASYMDLSVLHDNEQAIALYEKLGFRKITAFAVKHKNPINEKLYAGELPDSELNPYARLITDEARRRGIFVHIIDAEDGYFRLSYGGRTVNCRESLSEFTSAVAMSICDDKRVTRRIADKVGVNVAEQCIGTTPEDHAAFLEKHGSVVVKPARGEQGKGISVGLKTVAEVDAAIARAKEVCEDVILEACYDGEDLRLVVIDYEVVAVAIRRPARIVGDGHRSVRDLIAAQSRRRAAATGGESRIPMDAETERCIENAGYTLDSVPTEGTEITVRKTANLHTGGTIHDVTAETHPALIGAAIRMAKAIDIPVTGIDLMIKDHTQPDYIFIEANERPGLANHEPQPTAERFIDLLFPLSKRAQERRAEFHELTVEQETDKADART